MPTPFDTLFGAKDYASFLALFDRIYPENYLRALKDPGPGYELLEAYARIGERLALAVKRLDDDSYITTSSGGAYASVAVRFSRPSAVAGAVTVKAGTAVQTSKGGRLFITTEDAVFGALDLGPITVQAVAEAQGYEYNVPGQRITAAGVTLPGEIDAIAWLLEDPVYGDPSVIVDQSADASGGKPATLDQLGVDRGLPRQAGEGDDAYAARVRAAPDTVSPGAIRRTMAATLAPLGRTGYLLEAWSDSLQTCWNDPRLTADAVFVYNDPRPPPPWRNRWLSESTHRGAFILLVPRLPVMREHGMVWNDPGLAPADFQSGIGARAQSVWNGDSFPASLPPGGYNGADYARAAVYASLWARVLDIKAAGVLALVVMDDI